MGFMKKIKSTLQKTFQRVEKKSHTGRKYFPITDLTKYSCPEQLRKHSKEKNVGKILKGIYFKTKKKDR